MLGLATSGSTQRIELGVDVGLRFDEAASIIAHGLVTRLGVLRGDGDN
jgi:hypothetical protein